MRKLTLSAVAFAVLIANRADGQADGRRTSAGDNYGPYVAIQMTNTDFGDNSGIQSGSELDAAYFWNDDTNLYLMFTGNLENNFNRANIFIDSVPGGENVLTADVNNGGNNPTNDGWANRHAGLRFDAGFSPDYLLIARAGVTPGVGNTFDLDFNSVGNAGVVVTGTNLFNGSPWGFNGMLLNGIMVGFDDSNTHGISGGSGAANQAAAAAVTTGLEFTIPLAEIGASPGNTIKIAAMINGQNHDFLSNQALGAFAPPQGNLGGDGAGNFTGNLAGIDLTQFVGDQFFTIVLEGGPTVVLGETLSVMPGIVSSGGLPELQDSDNTSLVIFRDPTSTVAVTQFVLTATSPTATPSAFEFILEGRAVSRPNVVQRVEFFNYVMASYEIVDEQDAVRMPPDLAITVAPSGDLSRFVDPTTLEIRARVRYRADSPRAQFSSRTDQAVWMIE
jgi:hypothetical protein